MFCISPTAAICGRIAYTSATRRQSFSTSLSSRATMWISWMTLKAGKVRLPILKKSAERTTHGVVWTIPKRDLHNLDQQEREYEAANVTVKLPSGDKVDCRTYFYLAYVQELVKIPDNGKTQNSNIGVDIDKLRSYVNGYLSL
ncbi:hypothetical protein MTO96_004856 [Rhipicephalus appendiculatus]